MKNINILIITLKEIARTKCGLKLHITDEEVTKDHFVKQTRNYEILARKALKEYNESIL